jgi:DNA primase
MKRISEQCIQDILARTDIVAIISDFIRLENKGGRYWGLCPFHNEKTPSFTVNREQNFFYCFGCKKGGSAVTFLMESEKMTYPEALEYLAQKASVPVVYSEGGNASDISAEEKQRESLKILYRRLTTSFQYFLKSTKEGEKAYAYLKNRGLSDETIDNFQLGYAPADPFWLSGFLIKHGYSQDLLNSSNLFAKKNPEYAFFHGRVMFPILDTRGTVVAFGGRILDQEGPKYLNSPESPIFHKGRNLFGYSQAFQTIKGKKEAIICEGYMDVISLHQAGITNAVAPLGTAFTEMQIQLLKRSVDTVILNFDSDSAGQMATEKAAILLEKNELEGKVVKIAGGKDASEILEKEGSASLINSLKMAISVSDYFIQRAVSVDTGGVSSKTQAIQSLFPYIQAIGSEVRRKLVISQVAKEFGMYPDLIERDLIARPIASAGSIVKGAGTEVKNQSLTPSSELLVMVALAVHRELYPNARALIGVQDVEDIEARKLYIALEESFRNEDQNFEAFLSRVENEAVRNLIQEKMASGEYAENGEKIVADSVRKLRVRILERKRESIKKSISKVAIDAENNGSGVNDLMYEKMFIDDELLRLKGERE